VRKLAIANRKGGVGKSTTAANLAAYLALANNTVLLVDTDTQAQCGAALGISPESGLVDLWNGADPQSVLSEARENLYLLSGSFELSKVSESITLLDRRVEYALTDKLKPYEGQFDFVILDTSPGFSRLSVNTLVYSDEIIVPVSMDALAVSGLINFVDELRDIAADYGSHLRCILPTFYDTRVSRTEAIHGELREVFGDLVADPIRINSALPESAAWGKSIFEHAPKSNGAKDYAKFAQRILNGEKTAVRN
jgi:chromosome partitioning protein